MKLIALDVGSKRIGVAKADSNVRIAIPSGTIEVDGNEFSQIASFARVYGTDCFIIGLPRNSKGEETAQSNYVRNFAKALKKAMPEAKIRFQDESLTSVEAEERLDRRKKKYHKGDIDAEAAAIILQDFLENFSSGDSKNSKKVAESSQKGHKMRNILLSLLAVFILICAGGYVFYRINLLPVATNISCSDNPEVDPAECAKINFTINEGDSTEQIANNLASAGLIRNATVFWVHDFAFYRNQALQTGDYSLDKTMSVDAIIEQLIKGSNNNVFSFTILPGETIAEIKQKLVDQGYETEVIESAFTAIATPEISEDGNLRYSHPVLEGKPAESSLEGYIFGDTYEFYKGESVENIIKTTLDALNEKVTENDLITSFSEHGLNLYQGITLASITQKEAKNASDQATVAQIFYTRLNSGIPLGSDVTAKYAADLVDPNRETYTNNTAILQIDSPYNTRLYAGLPAGPICNPGIEALIATAYPSDTSYLFFLTGDDEMMYYSYTDSEHQQNIAEHCHELCNVSL